MYKTRNLKALLFLFLVLFAGLQKLAAQSVSVYDVPNYGRSEYNDYITDISALSNGGASTISVVGTGPGSVYHDNYATQGIIAYNADSVKLFVARNNSPFSAWIAVYVDWDADNLYQSSERAAVVQLDPFDTFAIVSFVAPCHLPANLHAHMRVMLTEKRSALDAPGSANWGEAFDFFLAAPCTPPIVGVLRVCTGQTDTLSNVIGCGTWSSSNLAVANVSPTGVVYGINAGTAKITYTTSSCGNAIATFTVYATPTVSAPDNICLGTVTTLSGYGSPSGGTWSRTGSSIFVSSGSPQVMTTTGIGESDLAYTGTNGCAADIVVSVTTTPSAISGATPVCVGQTMTLTNTAPYGTWSTASPTIAAVSATSGIVTGVHGGTATITYTNVCGTATTVVSINGITGPSLVCLGGTITLTGTPAGGTWSTAASGPISVSGGIVSGLAGGGAYVTYSAPGGCTDVKWVAVDNRYIMGLSSVCVGSTIQLIPMTPGDEMLACDGCANYDGWSSSNTSVATVGTTGIVSGVSSGTAVISFTSPASGCLYTLLVTVWGSSGISGTTDVCLGGSTILYGTAGSSWSISSSTPGIVSLSGTGTSRTVYGVALGTATVINSGAGCISTTTVTVRDASVSGASTVCKGANTSLSGSPGGGAWMSSNAGVATVSTTGNVTGVNGGTAVITYFYYGCVKTHSVTVHPIITGSNIVCAGGTIALTGIPSGGTWSTSDGSVATVTSSGVVTGIAGGAANISYQSPAGCLDAKTVYVPEIIEPTIWICKGSTITLSPNTAGGYWTPTGTSFTTSFYGNSLLVRGTGAGHVSAMYTVGGCFVDRELAIYDPAIASGPEKFCSGRTVIFTSAYGGGSWWGPHGSFDDPSIGVFKSNISESGTFDVYYTLPTWSTCTASRSYRALQSPIPWLYAECTGLYGCDDWPISWSRNLSAAPTGGTWSKVGESDMDVMPDAGGAANAHIHPRNIHWSPSAFTYTLSYPADGLTCPVRWNVR